MHGRWSPAGHGLRMINMRHVVLKIALMGAAARSTAPIRSEQDTRLYAGYRIRRNAVYAFSRVRHAIASSTTAETGRVTPTHFARVISPCARNVSL